MPRISEIEEDGGDPTLAAVFEKEREIFGGIAESHQGDGALPADPARRQASRRIDRAVGAVAEGAAAADLSAGRLDQRLPVLN